ncbi:MAG: hypothetical protein Q9227_005017 [Pyrenula ochraceoflavens]
MPLTISALQQPRSQFPNSTPGYLPNGNPGATPLLPNAGRVIQSGPTRILCVADVRGNLKSLNELAKTARADHILHTGDFGFYDDTSLERIADKTLKHVAQYSPLLPEHVKRQIANSAPNASVKNQFQPRDLVLSELSLFLSGQMKLDVPVYTVWGACEDVRVLEKFRSGEYKVDKLHIIDEASSRLLDVGGVKLRLLGLGGAVVMHKLFDNGEGKTSIAGGQGTMWTTLLQMGELVDTANRVYDPAETRIFITHASPAREGMLNQLSVTLKADFSISAGLHFRYGSSYNEFSVNPNLDHYRGKLAGSKMSFNDVWETVRGEVESALGSNEGQKTMLENALDIIDRMPISANGGTPFGGPGVGGGQVDESAFKNMWNFNLADAAYGWLVLEVDNGRIGTEMRAQGFNFAHRGGKPAPMQAQQPPSAASVPTAPAPTGPAQTRNPPSFTQPTPSAPAVQPQPAKAQPPPAAKASPAPSAPAPATQGKPVTPQPPPTNTNVPSASTEKPAPAATAAPNGVSDSKAAPNTPAKPAETPKQELSTAVFISQVDSEQAARDVLKDEHKSKVKRVQKMGNNRSWMIDFENHEDCKAALEGALAKNKEASRKEGYQGPRIKFFEDRSRRENNWNSSNRGASNANTPRTGYQSGQSDSEGGRGMRGGRGGFRARGDRGGRGGRGGGRGSFQNKPAGGKEGTSDSPKPAPAAATTES